MNSFSFLAICALVSYLIGSISNAVIVAKANGVDILKAGSGNPGATNVKRVVGSRPGNLVFLLDLLKGFVVSIWPFFPFLYQATGTTIQPVLIALVGLAGALLGHSFSIYIRFKGGKGVATAMGGLLAIMAPVVFLGMIVWVIVFYTFRYVSLASIAFAASLPAVCALFWKLDWAVPRYYTPIELYISLGVFLLIVIRHHSNISRLLNGTENKFEKKPSKSKAEG